MNNIILNICTALRNPNRTVFEEMTSWTPLSWHIGPDEDNNLDQIYEKQIFSVIILKELQHSTTRNS